MIILDMIFCLSTANVGDKSEKIYSKFYNYVLILHMSHLVQSTQAKVQ